MSLFCLFEEIIGLDRRKRDAVKMKIRWNGLDRRIITKFVYFPKTMNEMGKLYMI